MKKIFISAGDPSADLYGGMLAKSIKNLAPEIQILAYGGENIKKYADFLVYDLVGLNIHGFDMPLLHMPKIFSLYQLAKRIIKSVDTLILIDFYDFNIKLAKFAYENNIPVYYYVCPQVWANRFYRIKSIRKYITECFLIYPFEKEIYESQKIKATYVGHPLLEVLTEKDISIGSGKEKKVVGLFPGSRSNVISWHLQLFEKLQNNNEFDFIIFGLKHLKTCYKTKLKVVYDEDFKLRKTLDFAVSTSGTVVLENSLLNIPTIVVYRLPYIWYLVAKTIVRTKYISLPNIIFNEEILPECIQRKATPKNITEVLRKWSRGDDYLNPIYQKLKKVRELFGNNYPSEIVAQKIVKQMKWKHITS